MLKDGSIRYIESYGNIILNEEGKPYRVVVVSRDITDYKLAENEIIELNRDLAQRVSERTAELELANENLQEQILVREKAERVQNSIYFISEAIHKSPDLQSLFSEIHSIVGNLMSAQNFYISLYDPKTEIVSFPYRIDEYDKVTKPRKYKKGLTEYVLRTGESILVRRDVLAELVESGKVEQSGHNTAVWLGIPLMINKRALGVMAVQDYYNENAYSDDDRLLLTYISEQVAYAIEKKRNEESEKKRIELVLQNRNVLIELAKMDLGNFEEAISRILETTAKTIGIERVGFWRLDKETQTLRCETLFSLSENKIDENAKGTVLPATFPDKARKYDEYIASFNKNRPLVAFDAQADTSSGIVDKYLQPLGITSMMDVPVWFMGEIVGIICLEHKGPNREFILEEEDFMASVATMVSLAIETSIRRAAEKNLKASEHQYKVVSDNAYDAIIVAQDGMIRFANPRATVLTGYAFHELSSKMFVDFIHPDDREVVLGNYLRRMKGEEVESFYPFKVICKDGNHIIVEVNAVAIEWQGKPATLNFLTDVTERKRAEEEIKKALEKERELSELRSRFISMTSHEFRTPLTSIMSSAEIIEKYFDKLSAEQLNKNLHRIQENVKHMSQLLNDVLIIGKTEAGKLELNRQHVNLKRLCHSIVEQFEMSTLQKTKRNFKFVEKDLCENASLDPKLIRQILDNLISNAVKYSPENSDILFEAGCTNDKIFFKIQDNGIGIPVEDQKRLFEPFYRATNVGTISGTGLGMAIVKNSVELHGGTITLESEENAGARFIVELPLITA